VFVKKAIATVVSFKTISIKSIDLCFIEFFYIYIYGKKFNADFIKLIKTVGHHARFFWKIV